MYLRGKIAKDNIVRDRSFFLKIWYKYNKTTNTLR